MGREKGNPGLEHVATSYAERSYLAMRIPMRRFTKLTNAFSKTVENRAYAVALHMLPSNFVRIHSKLPGTPAMAAGVSDRLWEVGGTVVILEAQEPNPRKRGPCKKREASSAI